MILLLKAISTTCRKFGAICDHIRKNTKASGNCSIIYLKSKHSHKHCVYNGSWLNSKTEKVWLVCLSLHFMLLLMFYTIVFVFCHHVNPNGFPYLLHTLNICKDEVNRKTFFRPSFPFFHGIALHEIFKLDIRWRTQYFIEVLSCLVFSCWNNVSCLVLQFWELKIILEWKFLIWKQVKFWFFFLLKTVQ